MKIKIIAAAILLTGIATNVNAQATATASTSAVLVAPISISKTTDMHFGTIATNGAPGTVVLDYANGRTATGGVTLIAAGALEKTAEFSVTGADGSITIAIPTAPITLTRSGGGTMSARDFVCEQGAAGTINGGPFTIRVKATLELLASTVAGPYTNASGLFVTVNYN